MPPEIRMPRGRGSKKRRRIDVRWGPVERERDQEKEKEKKKERVRRRECKKYTLRSFSLLSRSSSSSLTQKCFF